MLNPSVQELTQKFVTLWQGLPAEIPAGACTFTQAEQEARKERIERLLGEVERDPRSAHATLRTFAYEGEGEISPFRRHERAFSEASREFIRQARAFDRGLDEEDVHQALRNFWVFNALQLVVSGEVKFQQGAFAYSLLYPYTDNFFDDTGVSPGRKRDFGEWLSRRLSGTGGAAHARVARKVDALISLIEEEFPRSEYPLVYEGLLAIHDAQIEALGAASVKHEDIVKRSVRKGGTSVLADALLVQGRLPKQEAEFSFRFGVLLQFLDDLQDGVTDGEAHAVTLFSGGCPRASLQASGKRLIRFLFETFDHANLPDSDEARRLSGPMSRSCIALAGDAVWRQADRFDREFVEDILPLCPLHPEFLTILRRRAPELRRRFPGGLRGILLAAD